MAVQKKKTKHFENFITKKRAAKQSAHVHPMAFRFHVKTEPSCQAGAISPVHIAYGLYTKHINSSSRATKEIRPDLVQARIRKVLTTTTVVTSREREKKSRLLLNL